MDQALAGLHGSEINTHKQNTNTDSWYKLFILFFVCNFCECKIETLSSCHHLYGLEQKPSEPQNFT